MVVENLQALNQCFYNVLDKKNICYYLRKVGTLLKLHLNDHHLNAIPSLLSFYSEDIRELSLIQMREMDMDLAQVIYNTQHLRQDHKDVLLSNLNGRKKIMMDHMGMNMDRIEVKWMRQIYHKYRHVTCVAWRQRKYWKSKGKFIDRNLQRNCDILIYKRL